MELTKQETRTIILAIGVAIEKEKALLDGLKTEVLQLGISAAITERTRYIQDLDRIRKRLRSEQ